MTQRLPAALPALAALLFAAAPARADEPAAPAVELTLPAALASQLGTWQGRLEYLDYTAKQWFGLPVKVELRDGGDGVTQIRIADFNDGPAVGNVRITSMAMLAADGTTEYSTSFRKGRMPELAAARLGLVAARDAQHWTIVALRNGMDDNRPALIRETTVREGTRLTTLKEVDFSDDTTAEWLTRNRTTLERLGD